MTYYSPLRYPGGKRRLLGAVVQLLEENGCTDIDYVEPFAGGAALALTLLFQEHASTVHMNDLSRPVYAFWRTALEDTDELCRRIECTDVNVDEWHRQRGIYETAETADIADLGFATFFLNRTNRSGIIGGGVIGGKSQSGKWTMTARFNKNDLIKRIRRVGRYRSRIHLHCLDALEFTGKVIPTLGRNTFTFYDPPYIESGEKLYLDNYMINDHRDLASAIVGLGRPWLVTYDYAAVRENLFQSQCRITYDISYTAQDRHESQEVMFLSDDLALPREWSETNRFFLKRGRFPICGKVETLKFNRRTTEFGRVQKN